MKFNIKYAFVLSLAVILFAGASLAHAEVTAGDTTNGSDDGVAPVAVTPNPSTSGSTSNGSDDAVPPPANQGGGSTNPVVTNGDDDAPTAPVTNPPSGNGGGSQNTSNPGGGSSSSSGGAVLLSSTAPVAPVVTSCPLITDYLKLGGTNNTSQVIKLQSFLKNVEKLDVNVDGIFNEKTEEAVKAFQRKYLASILGPWDATRPTGFVYITTMKKINEIACASKFTITAEEQAIIDAYKARGTSETGAAIEVGQGSAPALDVAANDKTNDSNENVAAVGEASVLSRFWNFIKNLFR